MATTLVRSEIELLTQAQLAEEITSNPELFRTLENLHSHAARIIYNLKDILNEESLKIAKWKTLAYISKDKLFISKTTVY